MSYEEVIKEIECLWKAELRNLYDDCNKDEGDLNYLMQQKTGFLFFYLRLSVPLPTTSSLISLCVMRIPLSCLPLLLHHHLPSESLSPSTLVLALFLSLLICVLKLSDLLLTPSSSTQPAHSLLWDELWLILSLIPFLPTLPCYLPTLMQLSPSLPLSVALTS